MHFPSTRSPSSPQRTRDGARYQAARDRRHTDPRRLQLGDRRRARGGRVADLASGGVDPAAGARSSLRRVPDADVPDHSLTPGRRFPVVAAQVCVPGYASSVRHVTDAEKARVYARYGIAWVPYQHEIDHLISLELGGSNAIMNLWPEPYAGRWGARTKDVLENRMHTLVCSGQMSLAAAQHQEATDWVAAYRRYVGSQPRRRRRRYADRSRRLLRLELPDGLYDLLRRRPGVARPVTDVPGALRDVPGGDPPVPGYHLHQPC